MMKLRFPRFAIAVEFTREGLLFVLLCLAIGAAAVNTGNNVLYLIFSVMLALIVVSGMISRRVLLGLSPTVVFPENIFSGISNVCYVSVNNRKKRIPSIAVRFAIRDPSFADVSRHFFYIPSSQQVSGFAPVLFSQRGIFHLKEMELQTRFPFSFFVKIRRYRADQSVRVYPKVYKLSEEMITRFAEGILEDSPYRGDSQQLLYLREYTPFDSSKRIHWKASAKIEKLLIKEFQKDQGRDLYLYFDCFPQDTGDDYKIIWEKSISFIASLALFFTEKGIAAKIIFPDFTFSTGKGSPLLPLLKHLSELRAGELPPGNPEGPSSRDAVVVAVRSKQIPAAIQLPAPSVKTLVVEEWLHLMRDSVKL